MRKDGFIITGIFLLLTGGCHPRYIPQKISYNDYQVSQAMSKDTVLLNLLQPFGDSMGKQMNGVVGYVESTLLKEQPNSSLGNFIADAMLNMGSKKYGINVDVAFVNYGGVRLNDLPPGNITKGKVFEIMPFDNVLELQKIKGSTLLDMLQLIAGRNGWPVAGVTMQIADKKAIHIKVGGKDLDPGADYIVANSDFVINGGDNVTLLKTIPVMNNGYLVRDAILDYIKELKSQGKNIAPGEIRISYAE